MISDYRNKHYGETAIVIGNGPSLRSVPLDFLRVYTTFGQNKCYLPPLDNFTPTFFVSSDPDHDLDYSKVLALNCPKFLKFGLTKSRADVHEFALTRNHVFSFRPDLYVYEGYSVTFVSLQIAFFMGFTNVLLVGVDHRYIPYDPRKEKDPNRYNEDYGGVTNWSPESLAKGERFIPESMQMAREAYEADGRRVINLNPTSRLTVFEFGNLEDWFIVE